MQFTIKEFHMYDLFSKILSAGWDLPLVGGTAINKIYLVGEERVSEDLDFELYGKRKLELPKVEGFSIKGPFTYRRNIRFEAEYIEDRIKDKIRIDVNIKPKSHVKIINKSVVFLTQNTIANVNTFSLEALVARKLLAMTRRTDGKDFYDLWHAIPKTDCNSIKKEIKWIEKLEKINHMIPELKSRIEKTDPTELSKFNNYIPIQRRPDWKLIKKDVLTLIETLS